MCNACSDSWISSRSQRQIWMLLGNLWRRLQIWALSRSLLQCFLATFFLTCNMQVFIQSESVTQLSQPCCRTTHVHHLYIFNNPVNKSRDTICTILTMLVCVRTWPVTLWGSHETFLSKHDEKYVLLVTKASLLVFSQFFPFSLASFDLHTRGLLPLWNGLI